MIIAPVNWNSFKISVTGRAPTLRYVDTRDAYLIGASNSVFNIVCTIEKSEEPGEDQVDFETNFKDQAITAWA